MTGEKKCRECGFLNDGDTCLNCGTNLGGNVCPGCNSMVTSSKRFCSSCGFDMEGRTEKVKTVITPPPLQATYPVQNSYQKHNGLSQTPLIATVIILTGIIAGLIVFLVVKPGRNNHQNLAVCEGNLKSLASACVMYATDNKGHYPESLEQLVEKGYINEVPLCPACKKPYIYSFQPDPPFFLIKCGGNNAHLDTGNVSAGNYPVYNPRDRLVKTGDFISSITPTPLPVPTSVPASTVMKEPPSVKDGPVALLKKNYKAIDEGDLKTAYNLRSSRFKNEEMSYNQFYENWKTNETMSLEYTEVMYEAEEKAKVKIRLYSKDRDAYGAKSAYYSGSAYLVKEGGQWRIDKVDVQEDYGYTGNTTTTTTTKQTKPHSVAENCGIIPDSQYRYLTTSDLRGLSAWQLNIARNEIYARHGRPFDSGEYKNYFTKQWWYDENSDYQDWWVSEMEQANAALIKDYQNKTGLK